MTTIKVFYRDECVSHPGKYIIRANLDKFFLESTTGSFHIIGARLMGLTYADYLRMCRDCFGAEIVGKGSMYPYPIFKASSLLEELIKKLNERAELVLLKRNKEEENVSNS